MRRSRITPAKHRVNYALDSKKRRRNWEPAPDWHVVRQDIMELLEKHPDGLFLYQIQEKITWHEDGRLSRAARFLLHEGYIERQSNSFPYRVKRP